jgi:hypothetical protein
VPFRVHVAETKAFVKSGKMVVSLGDLPRGYRIRQIAILLGLDFTFSAATTVDFTPEMLARVIDTVRIGKRIRVTGTFLSNMDWMLAGKDTFRPAKIAIGANGAVSRRVETIIPFADLRAVNPDDTSPNTEFFADTPLEIGFANTDTVFPAADIAKISALTGTARVLVFLDDAPGNVVPTPVVMNYDDWSQKTVFLPAGVYSHLMVFKEDGAQISDTEVSDISLWADGEKIYDQLKPSELAALFNYYTAKGVGLQADGQGGEAIDTATPFEYLPLVFSSERAKISKLLDARKNLRLDINGTLTTIRIGYRMLEPTSPAQTLKAAMKIGIPNAAARAVEPKTVSKKAGTHSRKLFRVLPKKFN